MLDDPLVKKAKDAVTSTPGLIATGAARGGRRGGARRDGQGAADPAAGDPAREDLVEARGRDREGHLRGAGRQADVRRPDAHLQGAGPEGQEEGRAVRDRRRHRAAEGAAGDVQAQERRRTRRRQQAGRVRAGLGRAAAVPRRARRASTIPLLEPQPGEKKEKKEETSPAQPAPASPAAAPPAHAEVDGALATPGRPLDPSTRRSMEARFGYDFSGVRVHDDARAAATAAGIDAAAFTVGEDVVFGAGRFDPTAPQGRHLLAHELAHVVQQSQRRSRRRRPDPAQERVRVARDPARDRGGHLGGPRAARVPRGGSRARARSRAATTATTRRARSSGAGRPRRPASTCCRHRRCC